MPFMYLYISSKTCVFEFICFLFSLVFARVVGMNKILSFLVETEFLVDFDKSTKKNCIVSFLKNLEILCLNTILPLDNIQIKLNFKSVKDQ